MITSKFDFTRRLFLLAVFFMVGLSIIVTRLIHLQVHLSQDLFNRSQKNFTRKEPIVSLRGNIFDMYGKLLATNRPVITVYWQGTGKSALTEEQKQTLEQIKKILNKPDAPEIDEAALIKAERFSDKFLLAKDLSFKYLSKIREFFPENENIIIETESSRFYPHQTLASHLLGYLGYLDVDFEGKSGLEKMYEEMLKGTHGKQLRFINSFGKNLGKQEIEKASSGQDIYTTLDLSLQQIAEEIFPKDVSGVMLLMDPEDGAIRVFLSHPHFDPNIFLKHLDKETWESLQSDSRPFLNRIFHACYPPGSLFKLVTLSAALERSYITQKHEVYCRGFTNVGRRTWCHKHEGHGRITAAQAIAFSCNVMFYELSKIMDVDVIAHYAFMYGLGKQTNELFKDAKGLIPTRAWKKQAKGESWWLGETLSVSIGQSFLLVTPIQIARMLASIETGYLVTPRVVEHAPATCEPLAICYKTRQFLKDAMKTVAEVGTARMLNNMKDFTIWAKTSTAQTSMLENRELGAEHLEHGWLGVNFRYKNHKPMTMVILTEKTGTAALARVIAKTFFTYYRKIMESREQRAVTNVSSRGEQSEAVGSI